MKKKFTVTFYIGEERVDSLTEEQLEKMSERLSEAMSTYYTAHPEEYREIKD